MVNQYLKLETNDTKKIKRPRRLNEKSALANEFVYDVYYREASSGPVIDTNVGVIRFEQEDLDLLHQEDDELSDYGLRSDDEDSNAEDFYRNDYPDNEDDDKGIVIGNEDEWYSDEEYDKPNQDYLKWQEEEQPQGNKGFEGLSLEEVEHLYQEFYNENNAGEEQ